MMEENDKNFVNKYPEYSTPEKTGKFIRKLRIAHHLTQEQVGQAVYVTRKSVSKWENGICYPSLDVLARLADLFNVTSDELLYGAFDNQDENATGIRVLFKFIKNKVVMSILITFLIILITSLTIFYFNNRNSTKLYQLYYEDDMLYVKNCVFVTTKSRDYFNFGYFATDDPDFNPLSHIDFVFYIKEQNNEKILLSFSQENLVYTGLTNYKMLDTSNNNINNLYLKVSYTDKSGEFKEHDLHLKVKSVYRSNDIYNYIEFDNNGNIIEKENNNYDRALMKDSYDTENNLLIDIRFIYENMENIVNYKSKNIIKIDKNDNQIKITGEKYYIKIYF